MANPIAVFMFHVSCCFFCLGVGWLAPLLGGDGGRKLVGTEKKKKKKGMTSFFRQGHTGIREFPQGGDFH